MLFRPADVDDLAAKLLLLIDDRERCAAIGRRARAVAEQRPLGVWTQAYADVLRRAARREFSAATAAPPR
jgi:glycosyltransferase involved in cell wall biosynthesis